MLRPMKTSDRKNRPRSMERGIATIEFAVTAGFFFMMIIAVVAGGHFFWTHNALVESTRRGVCSNAVPAQCHRLRFNYHADSHSEHGALQRSSRGRRGATDGFQSATR